MTDTHATPAQPAASLKTWLPALLLCGGFWLLLFNQQRLEWSVNVTYAYGWAVPFLAGYLLWERWQDRPALSSRLWPRALPLVFATLALLAYLPLRLIHEADPDWVKINWASEAVCLGVSFAALAAAGGWRYVLHFGFPLLFCWTALPWPVWLEENLTQMLMRGNATVCAEVMTALGTPAMAHGNLIQVGENWVNVETACSGIRSLQTAFMMALFLGEFHRLGLFRRGLLLVLSITVAALFNAGRTLLLTHLGTGEAIDKWHDTIGNVTMVVTLLALYGASELLKRGAAPAPKPEHPGMGERPRPFPWTFALVGLTWLAFVEGGTEWWYRSHEKDVPPPTPWGIAWPEEARGYKETPMHERTLSLLKYNRGHSASWVSTYGYRWQMYFLEWDPGRVSKHLAQSHYPTVCLPATGMTLVGESGNWDCSINGIRIPFRTYIFRQGNQDVHIFHAIMEDRPENSDYRHQYYQVRSEERYAAVLRGERNLGQKVLGIALVGPGSPGEARYEVSRLLRKIISTAPKPAQE